MAHPTVLVTGANGYIGNATARAFVAAGWVVYGLVRSPSSAVALSVDEIFPVVGSIDDTSWHAGIVAALPAAGVDAIVSTTEDMMNYVQHFGNIVALCTAVADATAAAGEKKTRPLVIFTSGCKDYGVSGPHSASDPRSAPDTEETPISPPGWAAARGYNASRIFEHYPATFPAVMTRPVNLFGRSSSFWRVLLDASAATAAAADARGDPAEKRVLRVPGPVDRDGILHALHIDDCGDAYVAIAETHLRLLRDGDGDGDGDDKGLHGEVFNIAPARYETVDEVVRALAAEYGLAGGVEYLAPGDPAAAAAAAGPESQMILALAGKQWVSAEKLRRVTGWADKRPLFAEALHRYRLAFEAAESAGSEMVRKNMGKTKMLGEMLLQIIQQ